jgi:hypothetical protein
MFMGDVETGRKAARSRPEGAPFSFAEAAPPR